MKAPKPPRRLALGWIIRLALLAWLLLGLTQLAEAVWEQQVFPWDSPFMLAVNRASRPWLNDVVINLTESGGGFAFAAAAGLALLFWRFGEKLEAVTLAAGFGGAGLLNALLKLVFARPRPEVFEPLFLATGFSFPSGHTVQGLVLYGSLGAYLWRRGLRLPAILCGIWAISVGFSRIYLGVHYPSDVLGGLYLGSLWLVGVYAARGWLLARFPALLPPAAP